MEEIKSLDLQLTRQNLNEIQTEKRWYENLKEENRKNGIIVFLKGDEPKPRKGLKNADLQEITKRNALLAISLISQGMLVMEALRQSHSTYRSMKKFGYVVGEKYHDGETKKRKALLAISLISQGMGVVKATAQSHSSYTSIREFGYVGLVKMTEAEKKIKYEEVLTKRREEYWLKKGVSPPPPKRIKMTKEEYWLKKGVSPPPPFVKMTEEEREKNRQEGITKRREEYFFKKGVSPPPPKIPRRNKRDTDIPIKMMTEEEQMEWKRIRNKEYQLRNKEVLKEKRKLYRLKNKEKEKEYQRKWRQKKQA